MIPTAILPWELQNGDFTIDPTEWEALNNGDEPTAADPTEPEAPYITVETNRLVSIMNMNWNDNWLAYVGGLITPTPEIVLTPDYYQRRPGKPVQFTLRCYNTMYYSLDSVVTRVKVSPSMTWMPFTLAEA